MKDAEQGSSAHPQKAQQDFEDEVLEQDDQDDQIIQDDQINYALEQGDQEDVASFSFPPFGIPYAIITGIVAGVIGILLNLALTFFNAPLFQQVASAGNNVAYNAAFAVVGIQCINFLLSVFACFLAGYFVGKMVVQRRLGFYAGAIAGLIIYVVSLLVHYIPGYPGNTPANTPPETSGTTAGLITLVVFLFVWAFIGGLLSLWGAWMATRHHPYYATVEE